LFTGQFKLNIEPAFQPAFWFFGKMGTCSPFLLKLFLAMSTPPVKHRYFAINKPYKMVSQFKSPDKVRLLGELDFDFPEGTHAIGRLDNNSEGLLLLTTNKKVTKLLFESVVPHKRTYLVLVRNVVSEATLQQLREGVTIRVAEGKDYITAPCEAEISPEPYPFIHYFKSYRPDIPHTWLLLTLIEGKYHQVRKMVAAVHHQCKRLIRLSIEDLTLGDLPPGGVREMDEETFFRLLKIDQYE
jgi:23S rRNA pseudouridine2457 synthase